MGSKKIQKDKVYGVKLKLSGKAIKHLKLIAARRDSTMTDAIETAIRREHDIQQKLKQGETFFIKKKDGSIAELVFW